MEIKEIIKLYKEWAGKEPERVEKLPGAGSSRRYYRVVDGLNSVIATYSDDLKENGAFRAMSDYLRKKGVSVPKILAHSVATPELYLQSDHGGECMLDVISAMHKAGKDSGRGSEDSTKAAQRVRGLMEESIEQLVKIQTSGVETEVASLLAAPFCRRQILWDLNYFKYEFLKPSGVEFDEDKLEDDFDRYADQLQKVPEELTGFMYRDFQSRNIMVEGNGVTLIDFQGGRRGPVVYDIVSLLWQAKARLSAEMRKEFFNQYKVRYSEKIGKNVADELERQLPQFVLFRTLQVLGAYGFRGLVEKKAHFIESIPDALVNLEELLDAGVADNYPELKRCCEALVEQREKYQTSQPDLLTVEIYSFSYKKGYPADYSGNGGGFMFDCRGMHNPGRYAEYKPLTGLDRPVIDFLEERGEVQKFLAAAEALVDPAVACYERRGFNRLQVGFGCTGGQHRSVYCAQHLAEHIAEKFPGVHVVVKHREQGIYSEFNKTNR